MQPGVGGAQQQRTSPQQPPGMAGYPPLYYPVQQPLVDPNTAHQIPTPDQANKASPFKFPLEAPRPGSKKSSGRGSSSKKSNPKVPKQAALPPNALADPATAYYQHIQAYQAAAIAQTMMNGGGGPAVGGQYGQAGAVTGYPYGMDVYQHMYTQQHAAAAQYGYNGWAAATGYYGRAENIFIVIQ